MNHLDKVQDPWIKPTVNQYTEPCPHCGTDLLRIPEHYRPFVHNRPDGQWCLGPDPIFKTTELLLKVLNYLYSR